VTPIADDGELATTLAEMAGRIALEVRAAGLMSGKALGEAGDKVVNAFLVRAIAAQRPGDGLLSEESKDTPERLGKDRVWIVDPIDGTREYGDERSDWAVHVGLAVGGAASVGSVALPGMGVVLRSDRPQPLRAAASPPRIVVSRSRPPQEGPALAAALGAELVQLGSAGAKAMAVVRGEAEIYFHSGGQYEWDNCAPVAVAAAHGLHVSRADGSPLVYNRAEPYVPDLLICRPELARPALAALARG
jgi:3'(2'), 5'-bisphosphate nucleotidase